MEPNYLYSKAELVDELELDISTTESTPETPLKLILVNEHPQAAEEVDSYGEKRSDESGNKWGGVPDRDGDDNAADLHSAARPALAIYFKSINRYPLLDEETERNLAIMIKQREKECMQLMVRWDRLFKKEFLTLSSENRSKKLHTSGKEVPDAGNLFDGIRVLERERKQVARSLKKAASASQGTEELQEALNKIEPSGPLIGAAVNQHHLPPRPSLGKKSSRESLAD